MGHMIIVVAVLVAVVIIATVRPSVHETEHVLPVTVAEAAAPQAEFTQDDATRDGAPSFRQPSQNPDWVMHVLFGMMLTMQAQQLARTPSQRPPVVVIPPPAPRNVTPTRPATPSPTRPASPRR